MSLRVQVLGQPGWDNAVLATVDSGKRVVRLALDCGDSTLSTLPFGALRKVDALLLSHGHMDHISGFDALVRATHLRADEPLPIFGPPGTAALVHHRLQGTLWNLVGPGTPGGYRVHDVHEAHLDVHRFDTAEGFAVDHHEEPRPIDEIVWQTPELSVRACTLDHKTPCLAWLVAEADRASLDVGAMREEGLRSGPWCSVVKDSEVDDGEAVDVFGSTHRVGDLRERLLTSVPGRRLAYVTDALLDQAALDALRPVMAGADVLVAECAYRNAEAASAAEHHHMTAAQVGLLASELGVGELIVFHVSDRYRDEERRALLGEVREVFAGARFPRGWD